MQANKGLYIKALWLSLVIFAVNLTLIVVCYYIKAEMLVSNLYKFSSNFSGLLLYVGCVYFLRKWNGNYWGFAQAFRAIFLMIFMGGFLFSAASGLFFNYIETGVSERLKPAALENMRQFLESKHAPKDKIAEQLKDLGGYLETIFEPSVSVWLSSQAMSVLTYFILAAILAAVFKRESYA